ncbi:MAG: hypothetical protein AAFW97_17100, partial [Pseudomonadota bacterium]
MAENKTKPTGKSPADFIEAVEPDWKREDAKTVCALMERLSGEKPKMWGPSIIGFGQYHYKYESGREGDDRRAPHFRFLAGEALHESADGFRILAFPVGL